MSIKIVVDSASDITPAEASKLGVTVLPLLINFNGTEYMDSVNLTHVEFYNKLVESDVLPKTSQISPATFTETFERLTADGDTVLVITLSSVLSGTYQSACIAASDYEGQVYVVDSLNVAVGERILLERALKLIADGYNIYQLVDTLNTEKMQIRLIALLDTLEYLKKGGRISSTAAFAGTLLSLKPVVCVRDGAVDLLGKARGSRNGSNLLRSYIDESQGIDFGRPYAVAYSGLSDVYIRKYCEDHADLWKDATDEIVPYTIGCTIGTHVGPGAIAVAFFEKQ